jgi:DNA-binding NarL/FixJ family response regulator
MRSFIIKPDHLFRFQKTLLPSFGILFISAMYLLLGEVAIKLQWNETVYVLIALITSSFAVSLFWARIEFTKAKLLLEKVQNSKNQKEEEFQHKLNQLSFKEKEVLNQILSGKSNKEICASLFIEHSTLKSHINHIYKKLEVKSRKEMVLVMK